MAQTPESIKSHEGDYKPNAWENYTFAELGNWVHNFAKRAEMRENPVKAEKDLEDAKAYADMIQAKLAELHEKLVTYRVN